jgi:hypothetical protein
MGAAGISRSGIRENSVANATQAETFANAFWEQLRDARMASLAQRF